MNELKALLISMSSHMAYMQGQLEGHHPLDDFEDYHWYRESEALRAKVKAALAQLEPKDPEPTDEELMEIRDGAYCPTVDEINDEEDTMWQYTSDHIRWLDEHGSDQEKDEYEAKGLRAVFNAGARSGRLALLLRSGRVQP